MATIHHHESLSLPYPNTCEDCACRGEYKIWSCARQQYELLRGDFMNLWSHEMQDYQRHTIGWPNRCRDCNAKAAKRKRCNLAIKRCEEVRELVREQFEAYELDETEWDYLKFVTLTWKQDWTTEPMSPKMTAKARKWLRHKRAKISDKLDVLGGIEVIESVTKEACDFRTKEPLYHHHLHSHGIWVMPFNDIKVIGSVMKKYVGRDQVRAIKPKMIYPYDGSEPFEYSAFARARNYLLKYITKIEGLKLSRFGLVRKHSEEDWVNRLLELFSSRTPRESPSKRS